MGRRLLAASLVLLSLGRYESAVAQQFEGDCFPESGGAVRCGINGGAIGIPLSPGSKVVREGILAQFMEERRDEIAEPETTFAQRRGIPFPPAIVTSFLPGGLRSIRVGQGDADELAMQLSSSRGGRSSAERTEGQLHRISGLGVFASGFLSLQEQEETERETSWEGRRFGGAVGIDYRHERFGAGFAVDYFRDKTEYDEARLRLGDPPVDADAGGQIDADEFGITVFGLYHLLAHQAQRLYLLGSARFAYSEYDIKRDIISIVELEDPPGARSVVERTATADTDGTKYSFLAGAGYDVGLRQGIGLGVSMLVEYERTNVDGYEEDVPAFPAELRQGAFRFDDDDTDTLTSIVELRVLKLFIINDISVAPQLFGRYFHEFRNDSREIRAMTIGTPAAVVIFETSEPDRNYFGVGAGLQALLPFGLSAYVSWDTLLGHSFRDQHNITGVIRKAF